MFFSPSVTYLPLHRTGEMGRKAKHHRNPHASTFSKLILDNLVKMQNQKIWNNFSSFRIKIMVGVKEKRGSEALGKPGSVSSYKTRTRKKEKQEVIQMLQFSSSRFAPPVFPVLTTLSWKTHSPLIGYERQKFRSSPDLTSLELVPSLLSFRSPFLAIPLRLKCMSKLSDEGLAFSFGFFSFFFW